MISLKDLKEKSYCLVCDCDNYSCECIIGIIGNRLIEKDLDGDCVYIYNANEESLNDILSRGGYVDGEYEKLNREDLKGKEIIDMRC